MQNRDNRRILVIDDQEAIHEDFRKILGGTGAAESSARSAFFGDDEEGAPSALTFELEFSRQGDEGIRMLHRAVDEGRRFSVAFVDIRMPPGPDGIQTIKGLWGADPDLEVVICTAYSDYSFEQIIGELGTSHRLLILKKPFDPVEVRQLAGALTEKWNIAQRERARIAELQEANERAAAASRAKTDFLANMSHEIRTPMNAILGYVDLLCDPEVDPAEKRHYGETIRNSGEHLLTILNDILDISRIEACRMVLDSRSFEPWSIAREVVSLLMSQAAEKDLGLELVADGPVPAEMHSDPVRIRQILLNLTGNAIKFTDRGHVRIVMRTHEDGGDHLSLDFVVQDTGIGIDAEHLPRLFDPFSQVDTSTTRRAGGTGLGLAISKRLAGILHGDVLAESTPGIGSTFTLRLPVGRRDQVRFESCDAGGKRGAPDRQVADSISFPGHVLVVEDVRINQMLISTMLKKAGASVEIAADGLQGCEAVERASAAGEPFDVVLMDMQMPTMDGYEATRFLRAKGHRLPIVALTAHAMSGDRAKCLAAGCTDYLTKPLDRRELLETCARLAGVELPDPALPATERKSTPSP